MRVPNSVHEIAAEVIRASNRDHPADQALREILRQQRNLPSFDAAAISRLVFAYYRWHLWLRKERTVLARLRLAQQLDDRFQRNPQSFPNSEVRSNTVPGWVAAEMEITDDWLLQLQLTPKLWIRAKVGRAGSLVERLPGAELSDLLPDALVFTGESDLFKTPEFHGGEFEIQDIASQVVGRLCAPQPGETWWDACAGAGGKMLHLSDLMRNQGLIWASDRSERRLQSLKRRAARARAFNYRVVKWDGGAKLPTKTKFDGVLVDAPCSGLGTWQRNPHARWTTQPEDVAELAEIQGRLLANVVASLKPGGRLIYSVCTLTSRETASVAEQFAKGHPEFEPLPLTLPPGWKQSQIRTAAEVTIWPQDQGGNGMFVAGWRRK